MLESIRTKLNGMNKQVILLLLFALIVRICYLILYSNSPEWAHLTVDNIYHWNWAISIADGNIAGGTTYFRAPLYVYCLAIIFSLFSASLWAARIFGLIIGLLSILTTYLTGKHLVDHKTGILAAFLQSIFPILLYFESELLLDPLFMLLVQVAIYRFLIWIDRKSKLDIFLTGIFFGLAAITRPTILIAAPLFFLFAIYFMRLDKIKSYKMVWQLLLPTIGACLMILPIFARNIIVADDPVLISSQGGINFYLGNNEEADGITAKMPEPLGFNWQLAEIKLIAERDENKQLKPGEISTYWRDKAIDWIQANPVRFFSLTVKRLYYHLLNTEISNNRELATFFKIIPLLKYNPLSFGLIIPLAIIGIIFLLRRSKNRRVIFIISLILIYTFGVSLFFYSSRFRIPILPYLFIFGASGYLALLNQIKARSKEIYLSLPIVVITLLISFIPSFSKSSGSTLVDLNSKGLYQYKTGNFNQSIIIFKKLLAIDPNFPEANLNLGANYFRLSNSDSALFYFERERELYPNRPEIFSNLASLALVNNNYKLSSEMAIKALEIAPYDLTANRILVRATAASPNINTDSLAALCFTCNSNSGNALPLLNETAALLLERGLRDQSLRLINVAINLTPPNIEMMDAAFSLDYWGNQENWRKEKAKSFLLKGIVAIQAGDYRTAITSSHEVLRLDSSLVRGYLLLSQALIYSGDEKGGLEILDRAKSSFPENRLLLNR